jgi:GT2 family glycosyltransferase
VSDQANRTRGPVANSVVVTTVSVIIPCLDDTYINETLDSLAHQQGAEFEVIVVVDPRGDDISSRLEAWSDRLQLRIMTGDRGAHAGGHRNRGAALSRGRFLLFVDADDVVAEGYVCAMAEALQSHEFVCSSQDVQKLNPWHGGTVTDREGFSKSNMSFLPFTGAGTLGIRRSLFEQIGGFDPYLNCYQDADFCWRLQLAGHKTPTLVAGAVLHYRLAPDRIKRLRKAVAYGRTQALLYRRYRNQGMPREPMLAVGVAWLRLISRWVRRLTGKPERGLAWDTSLRIGRLQGSFRYRVAYL